MIEICAPDWFETVANIASIATAFFAAAAWLFYLIDRMRKRRKLENYLRKEKLDLNADSQHSIVHLMAELRMTEADILRAAFDSCHVRCPVKVDNETGLAGKILFEYDPN
jgi:hypothetical protein